MSQNQHRLKVAILAGGFGSRLAEETEIRPKPMVEIGGKPILWHIMKHYAGYGFREFVIALGYKGEHIKKYFADFCALDGHLKVDLRAGRVESTSRAPDWRIDLVDTGVHTLTGGRIKRVQDFVGPGPFMLAWGDGVSNVDLDRLVAFHRKHGKLATVTAVRPPARYGHLVIEDGCVRTFTEKPQLGEGWINGGFFVLEEGVLDYIDGDDTMFEHAPMERLAADGQLMAFQHEGFWQCMDTLREKRILEHLWDSGDAPWKTW